jgi:hypothetical protein
MKSPFLRCVVMLGWGASLSALAQTDFKATLTSVATAEGGSEVVMVVDADNERFSLQVPRGYGSQAHAENRSIVFTSEGGASVINLQFTTNYAGALPKQEKLRDQVAASHPGASLVASSPATTGFGSGYSFDLFRPAGNGLLLRIRDVYVAYPEGSIEMTFSCNSTDFDKQKLGFMRQLNSFRLLPKDAKTNP